MLILSVLGVDQRVPAKIWKQIFSYLYPSQLCRLSAVNHTFDAIVSSLPIWYHLFAKFNYKKQLRILSSKPASKCYMLYVCTNSLHICEECYWHVRLSNMACFPLPTRVPLPKSYYTKGEASFQQMDLYKDVFDYGKFENELLTNIPPVHGGSSLHFMNSDGNLFVEDEEIQSVGAPLNLTWTVRTCLGCRRKQRQGRLPDDIKGNMPRSSSDHIVTKTFKAWCQLYPGYRLFVRDEDLRSPYKVDQEFFLRKLEDYYGGTVGVRASSTWFKEIYQKTKARILWYRQQN